jgi:hypothetical protein
MTSTCYQFCFVSVALLVPYVGHSYAPTLDDLLAFDPTLHRAILKIRTMDDDEFKDLVDVDDDDVANVDDGVANSRQNQKEAFIERSMKQELVDSVEWQFKSLKAGFFHTVPKEWLDHLLVAPEELKEMVCGAQDTQDTDFWLRKVFRVEMDDELLHCKEL